MDSAECLPGSRTHRAALWVFIPAMDLFAALTIHLALERMSLLQVKGQRWVICKYETQIRCSLHVQKQSYKETLRVVFETAQYLSGG